MNEDSTSRVVLEMRRGAPADCGQVTQKRFTPYAVASKRAVYASLWNRGVNACRNIKDFFIHESSHQGQATIEINNGVPAETKRASILSCLGD